MSKGTLFWILLVVVVFLSRVFVSTKRDDDGDTNDAARTRDDDTVGGRGKGDRRLLFVF